MFCLDNLIGLVKLTFGILLFLGFNSLFNTNTMWAICFIDIAFGILSTFFIVIPVEIWLIALKENPKSFDKSRKRHENLFFIVPNVLFDAVFILGVCYANHPWLAFLTALSIASQWNWGDYLNNIIKEAA
jgi:hypothetical protein